MSRRLIQGTRQNHLTVVNRLVLFVNVVHGRESHGLGLLVQQELMHLPLIEMGFHPVGRAVVAALEPRQFVLLHLHAVVEPTGADLNAADADGGEGADEEEHQKENRHVNVHRLKADSTWLAITRTQKLRIFLLVTPALSETLVHITIDVVHCSIFESVQRP